MPHNKTSKKILGKIHLTDFHAPIEMPLEALPLGVEVFMSSPIHSKTPKARVFFVNRRLLTWCGTHDRQRNLMFQDSLRITSPCIFTFG